ncbi:MAG TPA: PrsW family intramembrane metalloprotease [Anaerolineales bacterium]
MILSIIFGFLPMFFFAGIVYWLDRYEKEPVLLLVGVFLWGAVVAAGAAFLLNTVLSVGVYLFTHSETATDIATGALIAPIVEESLKGFAVLIVFLVFRGEFDSLLDGIVYAGIAALGFAATENVYYIYTYGYVPSGLMGLAWLTFVRVVLVGWQHPFYTAFIGIGLATARLSRGAGVKAAAAAAGWLGAVITHAAHNAVSQVSNGASGMALGTALDWTGWFLMALVILWALYQEQRWITLHLQEEVALGLITPVQYRTACSAWAQSGARLGALFSGRYLATDRFYQACGKLALKKHQRLALGEEETASGGVIQRLQSDLQRLSPLANA